uniref:Uncharacterized protein n=1 Tax=Anopheles coluzzii TaxID=1518534 RepID=A0A8W7PG69_ANOCL
MHTSRAPDPSRAEQEAENVSRSLGQAYLNHFLVHGAGEHDPAEQGAGYGHHRTDAGPDQSALHHLFGWIALFELLSIDWQREVTRSSYSGRDVSNCSSWRVRSASTSPSSSSSPLSGQVSASVSIRLPSMMWSSSVSVSAPLDRITSNSCSVGAFEHSRRTLASSPWAVVSANANCSSFSIRSFSDGSRRIDHREERRSSLPAPPSELGGGVELPVVVAARRHRYRRRARHWYRAGGDRVAALGRLGEAEMHRATVDSYEPLLALLLLRLFALLEQFSSTLVGEWSDTRSSQPSPPRKVLSSRGFGSSQLNGGVSGSV